MKEVSRKFSGDSEEPRQPSRTPFQQPVRQPGTAMVDLRFVVKNSLNLGARFLTDVELFLKKINEEEPKQADKSGKSGDKES